MKNFTIDSPVGNGRRDVWTVLDMTEWPGTVGNSDRMNSGRLGNWYGFSGNTAEAIELVRLGDEKTVEESQRYFERMERHMIPSTTRQTIRTVAGGAVNVPAYLAGHPLDMRRRVKSDATNAPLTVVFDATTSGGISADDMRKRGITVLALVRALSSKRAVDLYVCCGLNATTDHEGNGLARAGGGWLATKLDTQPLDLARAAVFISHPMIARGFGYAYLKAKAAGSCGGAWPYNDFDKASGNWEKIVRAAFPETGDMLAIASIVMGDELIATPEVWLDQQIAKYGDADMIAA